MGTFASTFENVAVAATQDLFELIPASGTAVKLHGVYLYNVGTDVGDAQEEMLRITVRRLSGYTSGSGGSTDYPTSLDQAGGFARAAAETNNTTKATLTDNDSRLRAAGWNIRMPFELIWTPETRPVIGYDIDQGSASLVVVRLEANPADSITMSGTLEFEELG